MKKKKQKIDCDIRALDCMGNSVASANDCTGLIPQDDTSETAAEFYEQMYDYLPHGVMPEDKYTS